MKRQIKFVALSFVFILLSSCLYKMPTEGTYSVIPKTNNPILIQDEPSPSTNQAPF